MRKYEKELADADEILAGSKKYQEHQKHALDAEEEYTEEELDLYF